jgi:hypothetical protein
MEHKTFPFWFSEREWNLLRKATFFTGKQTAITSCPNVVLFDGQPMSVAELEDLLKTYQHYQEDHESEIQR